MQPFCVVKEYYEAIRENIRFLKGLSEQYEQELRAGIQSSNCGPAVEQLTPLILRDRYRTVRMVLDLPPDQQRSLNDATPRMMMQAQLAAAFKQYENSGTLNQDSAAGDVTKQLSEALSSDITVSFSLGGKEARWYYNSHPTFVSRIAANPWPDILFEMKKQWPKARIRLDSVTILKMERVGLFVKQTGNKPDLKTPLLPSVVAAMSEVFDASGPP